MQLLQINVVPVKYELEVTHAELKENKEFIPKANVETKNAEVKISSKPTELQLDTYQARNSLGFNTMKDLIALAAQEGTKNLNNFVRSKVEEGQSMAKTEDGVSVHQIYRDRLLENNSLITVFIPNKGADISWQPGDLSFDFEPAMMDYDWDIPQNQMEYIPGSVRLHIIQNPDINIEYLGKPMYVPPSAAPDYSSQES